MIKTALQFLSQVKQEFFRVTWGTKKQAATITLMVFIMVFVMAMFFFSLDWILSYVVGFLLSLLSN